jgi:hypothetical protein
VREGETCVMSDERREKLSRRQPRFGIPRLPALAPGAPGASLPVGHRPVARPRRPGYDAAWEPDGEST